MMKYVLAFILLLVQFAQAISQVKWDGEAGDLQWNNPVNWAGDIIPAVTDDVILDNDLLVGSYEVHLPTGNNPVTLNRLIIHPASQSTIRLVVPASNTSSPALFANAAGDAIQLDEGAILLNSSGAPAGTPVAVSGSSFFRINNGGKYVHNTERGHTTGLVSRLSAVPGTEKGIFEFDVPGAAAYTISASNRIYGLLRFSAAAAGVVKTYTASGTGPFTINDNLEINTNALLSYGANTNRIIVKGNCSIANGGTLNLSNGANDALLQIAGSLFNNGLITESGSSPNTRIEMIGTAEQEIRSVGAWFNSVHLVINNQAGARLSSPLALPANLQFVLGKLFTTEDEILTIKDNATCTGASGLSFVDGPMIKLGDDDFDFPLGIGGMFAPIGITGGVGEVTDAFMASYHRGNPQTTPGLGQAVATPIDHISSVEYWKLERLSGTGSRIIKMFVTPTSFAHVLPGMLVAQHQNGIWINAGASMVEPGPPATPYVTGTLCSDGPLADFGYFALATIDNYDVNPLPIRLISFTASDRGNDTHLEWELADVPEASSILVEGWSAKNGEAIHQGEDAVAPVHVETIAKLPAEQGRSRYTWRDPAREMANRYYRLRIVNPAAAEVVSVTRKVGISSSSHLTSSIKLWPNPASGKIWFSYNANAQGILSYKLIGINGVALKANAGSYVIGPNQYEININELSKGIYLLLINVADQPMTLPFIKH